MMNVPDGWKLVPITPTAEMVKKGGHVNSEYLNDNAPIGETRYHLPMVTVWEEMLAAAPAEPVAAPAPSEVAKLTRYTEASDHVSKQPYMTSAPDGDYVLYSDVLALANYDRTAP